MGNNTPLFFSLRWKLAILFGCVFLLLQGVFTFISSTNAQKHFVNGRKNIQNDHLKIAETLTKDSFMVLEQFAELVVEINDSFKTASTQRKVTSPDDENWSRWQLIWDIENITYFNKQGVPVMSRGKKLDDQSATVQQVLNSEAPSHRIFCLQSCYQQVVIPVLGETDIIVAFSVTKSFSDIIIKYRDATNSDIGVLVPRQESRDDKTKPLNDAKKYMLAGMTQPEKNNPVFEFINQHYAIEAFFDKSKPIEFNNAVYDVRVLPIEGKGGISKMPYFLFIDDITKITKSLNSQLKNIWLYSFLSLLASLFLIVLTLHVSLRRITRLSTALPLLSQHHFDEFRKFVPLKDRSDVGFDELDNLNLTALSLTDQLERLEQEMRGQTFSLLEKSQELAKERGFIGQLIELAPIIVIIQKLNGIIITINHAGADALEANRQDIIGKVFDVFLPDSDKEHIKKLKRLRSGENGDQFQYDGSLISESGKSHDISWLHKLMPPKLEDGEPVVLTLGMDISERKIAEARNIRMAYYDYLTGLCNRRKFQEEFNQRLASAKRYDYQLALFYLDLDRFKEINDTCGHEAGDNFLRLVANTLKDTIRSTDLLCRLGGDEFTLLMPHSDLVGIEHIASKINQVLKALTFTSSGKTYNASASIGIAIFPLHGDTVSDLMAHADLAMYKAKELGRGQHHLFNPDYDYLSRLNQTLHWRAVLEDAIANDKFVLFYQPILTIKTNETSHFECLVRLHQDDGTYVLPAEFVFRAEELGLIGKIDLIVLKKAIEQHLEFKRQGKNYKLGVNISKKTFDDSAVYAEIAALFDNPDIDSKQIIFEITDTTAVSSFQSSNILTSRIKALGCTMALNDFGLEYPSLANLRNAKVDYVKIDGSLIRQIEKSKDDRIFVKALIELAQAYGIKAVAEFVESEAILDLLKEFGIDYAQGYHIGKPGALE
ncbi:MAG: EAL domain-containing protein [Gammaproteobacteria bacterium]|nr:EAL domain-containing protein [Gammaproteobacteria bacterium]